MQILEDGITDLDSAERKWIRHFKELGTDLTNANDGGTDTSHIYGPQNDNIWHGLHTPLQEARMVISHTIRSMRRLKDNASITRWERCLKTLDTCMAEAIERKGVDWVNIELVKRNPDRYPKHLEALKTWAFSDA